MQIKKVAGWAVVVFLAWYLFTQPAAAGNAVHAADTYTFDKAHTNVGFQVRHIFTMVSGKFTDFAGTIQVDGRVRVAVDALEVAALFGDRPPALDGEDPTTLLVPDGLGEGDELRRVARFGLADRDHSTTTPTPPNPATKPPTETGPCAVAYTRLLAPRISVSTSVPPCRLVASPIAETSTSALSPECANAGSRAVTITAATSRVRTACCDTVSPNVCKMF